MGQKERLKSSYIYNFTKYVNWPETYKTGDFVIGVLGTSPIVDELNKLATSKKVISQTISVVVFNSPSEITKCHILFISNSNAGLIKEAMDKLNGISTLIIGESQGLATSGASINFIIKDGTLGFEFNEAAAKRKGLQVSSNLVELAR